MQRDLIKLWTRIWRWAIVAQLALAGVAPAQRVLVVSHTDTAPIVDGIETSPGEWAGATSGGDDWSLLTSNLPDSADNRFDALWDTSGIYFRHQVEYDGWQTLGTSGWNLAYDHLSFYFDPNRDGEPNASDLSIDGYKLSFNQPLGRSVINPTSVSAGMSSEAYVNSLFGSRGEPSLGFSGFSNVVMNQTASVEDRFGYTELFIPWADFDATHPDDSGLYHPEAPGENEQWYFNISRTTAEFSLPAWESPRGAVLFSERPHGLLEFAPALEPCDINADRSCDGTDIDALTSALIVGDQSDIYDTNRDGTVTVEDRTFYVEHVLQTYLGDSNLDGEFSTQDMVDVFRVGRYEDQQPGNAVWATGDWNGDLDFTSDDIVFVFRVGGFEQGRRGQGGVAAAVPEPHSLLLLACGLVLPALLRKRPRER